MREASTITSIHPRRCNMPGAPLGQKSPVRTKTPCRCIRPSPYPLVALPPPSVQARMQTSVPFSCYAFNQSLTCGRMSRSERVRSRHRRSFVVVCCCTRARAPSAVEALRLSMVNFVVTVRSCVSSYASLAAFASISKLFWLLSVSSCLLARRALVVVLVSRNIPAEDISGVARTWAIAHGTIFRRLHLN